ncbi:hypothetical protein P20311_2820 [Pseudoalteromonas sp. BSi20311]|uniref:O-antigen ligase family protein n=1 Tax=Pseudoalteromonas sp. BSi20311 TaxID=383911 RepID=UPI000231AC4D|nr:O-antigen ligase family protein [Pseudoalteromonas sp. BSi20311]GAA65016.1 hypothetical protein P20311_2820 [Pseudoalteromonas sp. BSi20311]
MVRGKLLNKIFFIFFVSFFFQQFWLVNIGTPLKPYMLLVILISPVLFFIPKIKVYSPNLLVLPFLFFLYMLFSFYQAKNFNLVIVRFIGIALLIIAYLILVISSKHITLESFYTFIKKFSYAYLGFSLVYYCMGLAGLLLFGMELDGDRKLFGLYMEGVLPRLRGGADSPNNFVLLLLLLNVGYLVSASMLNKKISSIIMLCSALCLLLTISVTGYAAYTLLVAILSLRKVKYLLSLIIFFSVAMALLATAYFQLEWFQKIINARVDRVSSGSGRSDLFAYILHLISEQPFFGFGLAQVREYLVGFHGRDLQSSHNSFLEVFFEGGVLAVLLFILCWIMLVLKVAVSKMPTYIKLILLSHIGGLLLISMANMMVYVELMILNLFALVFYSRLAEVYVNKK